MESILTSTKKMLGIVEAYEHFDADLIMHINSVLSILTQMGVGPSEGFTIKDKTAMWTDFIPEGSKMESVKSYVYMKVRLIFDPPQSSSVMEAMKSMISELEWRLYVQADPIDTEEENQNGQ